MYMKRVPDLGWPNDLYARADRCDEQVDVFARALAEQAMNEHAIDDFYEAADFSARTEPVGRESGSGVLVRFLHGADAR